MAWGKALSLIDPRPLCRVPNLLLPAVLLGLASLALADDAIRD